MVKEGRKSKKKTTRSKGRDSVNIQTRRNTKTQKPSKPVCWSSYVRWFFISISQKFVFIPLLPSTHLPTQTYEPTRPTLFSISCKISAVIPLPPQTTTTTGRPPFRSDSPRSISLYLGE